MKITIATICHSAYIKHLKEYLSSLKKAIKDEGYITYLLNSQMGEGDVKKVNEIAQEVGLEGLVVINTSEHLSIGAARNKIFNLSNTEWTVFFDADITVSHTYFEDLKTFLQVYESSKVAAIAGTLTIKNPSRFGIYEGLMDIIAEVGKIDRINKKIYENVLDKINFSVKNLNNSNDIQFWQRFYENFEIYEGKKINHLQGANLILNKCVKKNLGGFDESFGVAEDRDLAARIILSGYDILFAPKLFVMHNYNMPLFQILKRKMFHAKCMEQFLGKYGSDAKSYTLKDWFNYALSATNPPSPFNNLLGRIYYFTSFIVYSGTSFLNHQYKKNSP